MGELERHQRLDLDLPAEEANPVLSFDSLFSDGGGCMLGVLECRKPSGERVVLKAFSSLKGGIRTVEGWVPHLLGEEFFLNRVQPEQQRIKALSSEMELQEARSEVWIRLREDRKRLSQQLMEEIHTTYRLVNFRGQTSTLKEAFHADHGMGGKVGQCCAPKLLVHAARSGLHPTGIAEFHWGGNEHAGDRQQGEFYPACREHCQPILGFLLCGLESGSDE